MKRNGLAFKISSIWLIAIVGWAQTPDQCRQLAAQAEVNDQLEFALSLYERVSYFAPGHLTVADYTSMGRCYIKRAAFDDASIQYELGANLASTDSLRWALLLKAAWCRLMQRKFQDAQVILFGLPDKMPNGLQREKAFYTGITHFGLEQFVESERAFGVCFPDSADQQWLQSIFTRNERLPRRYNARRAKLLSTVFPGAGQLYIGDVKNGLNSFLLTGGLVLLGINYIIYYSWLDSLVSIAPWFQRYYVGGRNRAGLLAEAKVQRKRQALLNELLTR